MNVLSSLRGWYNNVAQQYASHFVEEAVKTAAVTLHKYMRPLTVGVLPYNIFMAIEPVAANPLHALFNRIANVGNNQRANHVGARARVVMRLVRDTRDAARFTFVRNCIFGRLGTYALGEFGGFGRFYDFLGNDQADLVGGMISDGTVIRITALSDERTHLIKNVAGRYLCVNQDNSVSFEESLRPEDDRRVCWIFLVNNHGEGAGGMVLESTLNHRYLEVVPQEALAN